LTAFNILFW